MEMMEPGESSRKTCCEKNEWKRTKRTNSDRNIANGKFSKRIKNSKKHMRAVTYPQKYTIPCHSCTNEAISVFSLLFIVGTVLILEHMHPHRNTHTNGIRSKVGWNRCHSIPCRLFADVWFILCFRLVVVILKFSTFPAVFIGAGCDGPHSSPGYFHIHTYTQRWRWNEKTFIYMW